VVVSEFVDEHGDELIIGQPAHQIRVMNAGGDCDDPAAAA